MIEEIRNQVEERTKRSITLNNVPVPVIKQFKEYCQKECNDVYSVGIAQLLKTKELYENIVPLLSSILKELNELKLQSNSQRRIKTFGDE